MFLQFIPRQSPQAGMHFNSFFLQVHNIKPHVFFKVVLQLQQITCRRKSGVGGKSVLIGFTTSPHLCQPQSHRSRPQSISSVVALLISKWTQRVEIFSSLCWWKWSRFQLFAVDHCCFVPSYVSQACQFVWILPSIT